MLKISERIQQLSTEEAFVVLQEAQNRMAKAFLLLIFALGNQFDTPENIKQAAIKAIKEGKTIILHQQGLSL